MLILGGTPRSSHAEIRALLIGVSSYPTLASELWLQGPRNDVPRMRQVLLARGLASDHLVILADHVSGAGTPTRANILSAIERLQSTATVGDIVILYFAGHGSREPVDLNTTTNADDQSRGWHSTILPIDVGRWDGQSGHVQNAIRDVELRSRLDRITKKGAFVWAIFDTCYSAGLVRGSRPSAATAETQYRSVDPRDLGVPTSVLNPSSVTALDGTHGRGASQFGSIPGMAPGRISDADHAAFFYATQADEVTADLSLPEGDAHAERHGVFSFTLARALESGRSMTYRQLSQMILSQYADIGAARSTPLFTGNGMDFPVMGRETPIVRQWPLANVGKLTVPVGILSDINDGAIFGIVAGPLAPADSVIGYVRVSHAEPAYAELVPWTFGGLPELPAARLKPGQYARIVQNPIRFQLRVAVDNHRCGKPCGIARVIQQLQSEGVSDVDVQWVTEAEPHDFLLQAWPNRLRFVPSGIEDDGNKDSPGAVGFPISNDDKDGGRARLVIKIGDTLHDIARSRNLLRLSSRLALSAANSGISTTVHHIPANGHPLQSVTSDHISMVRNGDRLTVTLRNERKTPMDLTLLWADSQYGITCLFPIRAGDNNRIGAGDTVLVDDIIIESARSTGREHLLLIAIEPRRLADRSDLSFLEQPTLAHARGAGQDMSMDIVTFLDAGFAHYRSRGELLPEVPTSETYMQVFTVDVRP